MLWNILGNVEGFFVSLASGREPAVVRAPDAREIVSWRYTLKRVSDSREIVSWRYTLKDVS